MTSRSTVISLKAIEMSELRQIVEGELQDLRYQTQLESMNDSELLIKVSKPPRGKTLINIQRLRHRPLEVILEVDYAQAEIPLQITRKRQNNNNSGSNFSYRWIWLILIFGGAILSILGNISQALTRSLQSSGLDDNQLIGILIGIFLLVAVGVFFIVPQVRNKFNQGRVVFDEQILALVETRIEKLQQELTTTTILRCWSCFKEIDFVDKICPYCGETQKS